MAEIASPGPVAVRGLAELQRDFRKMSKDLSGELRGELRGVAKPVAQTAEQLAVQEISGLRRQADRGVGRPLWSRMRIGVTSRLVYVAPQQRGGRGGRRPNFGGLLMSQAMEPALEQHADEIAGAVDDVLGRLAGENGF